MKLVDKVCDTLNVANSWLKSVAFESLVETKTAITKKLQSLGDKDTANAIIRSTNSDLQNGDFTIEEFK